MNRRLDPATPFAGLSPEVVLDAIEATGLAVDGRLFALNSYENRVYRVGIESGEAPARDGIVPDCVIAKFYRAARWSDAQIVEEHDFALELAADELPVAAPLVIDGRTLHRHRGFRYALFECRRGAAPDLDAGDSRAVLGRTMGRLHVAGGRRGFASRPRLDDGDAGSAAVEAVLDSDLLDPAMRAPYERVARDCVAAIDRQLGAAGALREIRLHGDCHLGNLLWNARGPVFVDLDDCLMGPAMQDLWMLVAGDARQQQRDWAALIEGYETFASFDFREVALIEALRTLRMIRHASWLAARWNDPAFPPAFPWFAGRRYWETHVSELREQLELIEDPPLLRML